MHTPEEALDELRHVREVLGFRAVALCGWVIRGVAGTGRTYLDTFGLESPHDYDPVWRYCEDHGLAATFHTGSMGWGSRTLTKNYMHNHVGHFAAGLEATARGLLFAGVPTRFPRLRFGFLEGGVGWGASLYTGFVGHWAKRNKDGVRLYDPKAIDIELMRDLVKRYGPPAITDRIDRLEEALLPLSTPLESVPDEFERTGFSSIEDIRNVFERSFFFGCEGDDPMTAVASSSFGKSIGVQLNPILGSDIGHWDLPSVQDLLHEVYEPVEHGVFTPADFRRMVFDAPVRLWADNNPDFFRGTTVEGAVRELWKRSGDRARAAKDGAVSPLDPR
jgi:hypothetical protein